MTRMVTAVVVGCGERGRTYSDFARDFPSRMAVVAVAETIGRRRAKLRDRFGISESLAFRDWRDLAAAEKLADVAIITTQDRMHREPAVAFANKGYHILLEKPMAVDEKECEEIAAACEESGVIGTVCHVLRYFPPCVKIKEIVDSGVLGDIVTINHRENIGFWHFAHSFVRGNWRNVENSTFSLLAKCCHDIDLIMYWVGDTKCKSIQSFGGLYHFKADQKPIGASNRCLDCPIEESCPYSAKKIYLDHNKGYPHWPMSVVCDIEDHPGGYQKALAEALETGDYGKCVYGNCDNNVCDHQIVNMEFSTGATAVMTMNAFTKDIRRETRICGTLGELRWDGSEDGAIIVSDFATRTEANVLPDATIPKGCRMTGHGGADFFLMDAFTMAVASGNSSLALSGMRESLCSHKLVFAAERSRRKKSIESVL